MEQRRRSTKRRRQATQSALGGLIVLALAAIPATMALTAQTVAAETTVITDPFNRTSENGWASAPLGGPYAVSNPAHSTVSTGGGLLSLDTPGASASALLPKVSVQDARIRTTFTLTTLPTTGNGVYTAVVLRRQSNRDSYRARARLLPGGQVRLSFSKVSAGTESLLGGETALPQKLQQGQALVLSTEITGTKQVSLTTWASLNGSTAQTVAQATDSSASKVDQEGAVGLWSYLSTGSSATAVRFQSLNGVELNGDAATKPPVVIPPVKDTPAPIKTSPPVKPSPTPPPVSTEPTPVEPQPSGDAGSAAVGSTSYAVPANAVFASPSGSDSGSGAQGSPFRTLGKAISAASSGSTIVLRGGTYHERVTIPANKKLTVQSFPKEAVWLDGSSEVTGWQSSGSTWVKSGWTPSFDSTQSFSGKVASDSLFQFVDAAHPMASHPDQVWIGSTALQQVGSLGEVKAGTFYLDDGADRLYIGSNPGGQTVRASDLADSITIRSSGSVVRGLGIHRYATSLGLLATLKATATNITLENLVVSDNATTGVGAFAGDITVRRITAERNGMLGLMANQADNLVVDRTLSAGNNVESFKLAPVSGGIKVTRSRGVTVRGSTFENNRGVGIWMDESVYDITITGNDIIGSASHGISLEISAKAVVADNVITGSSRDGIKINNTEGVQLWNNTFRGNGRTVEVVQDPRDPNNASTPGHDPRRPIPDPTMSWLAGSVTMSNNVFSHPNGSGNCIVCVEDFTHKRSATQMKVSANGNVYNRADSNSPTWVVIWSTGAGNPSVFTTVSAFNSATGQEKESMATDGAVFAPAAAAKSPANVAQPLPAAVAGEVGQPAGSTHLGAWR